MVGSDKRRGSRLRCDFLVAVEGEDATPCRRRGDLSDTGIYFERETAIGAVGTVQWLRIASIDGTVALEVMGRIIRLVSLDDIWRDTTAYGVALEFMPESREKIKALSRLVRHVDHCLQLAGAEERSSISQPVIHRMMIEASWALRVGQEVQVELPGPGVDRTMSFVGTVAKVRPVQGARGCTAHVELRAQPLPSNKRVGSESIAEAVDLLLDDLSAPSEGSRGEHLAGTLSRIRVPSLLCLFEMERMSGELHLQQDGEHGHVYVREGQVVDVRMASEDSMSARDAAGRLVGWNHGEFNFAMRKIERKSRLSLGTTALLLDLAREQDEAAVRSS